MKILIACLLASSLLWGCSSIQHTIQDGIAQDQANAKLSRELAKEILLTWQLNYGFLSGVVTDFKEDLPCKCMEDMETLLTLSKVDKPTDEQLGRTIYLWAKTWINISRSAAGVVINKAMPEMFRQFSKYASILGAL